MKSPHFILVALLAAQGAEAVALISLNLQGSMSDIERQTFIDAADFWNSTITGFDLVSDANGDFTPHALTITALVEANDGPGGVLGSAGPDTATYYDNNPVGAPTIALYYTTTGSMTFDSADVNNLVASNTFYGVVLHEMGHILGLGTLWEFNTDVAPTNYDLYVANSGQYTGPNALAQWNDEFIRNDTFVPVELGGGPGTANGHWNENNGGGGITGIVSRFNGQDFANELMTGWASSTFFLSNTTLGGLDDLGYIVDYGKSGMIDHVVIPEPTTTVLWLIGAGLVMRRRR